MVTTGDSLHAVKGAELSLCKTPHSLGRKGNSGGDGVIFLQEQTLLFVLRKERTHSREWPGMDLGVGSEVLLAFTDSSQMNVLLTGGWGEQFLLHGTIHNLKHGKVFVGEMKKAWRERRFQKEVT